MVKTRWQTILQSVYQSEYYAIILTLDFFLSKIIESSYATPLSLKHQNNTYKHLNFHGLNGVTNTLLWCHEFGSIRQQLGPDNSIHVKFPFLYARLQTGRIMVWWCPSVQVSVRLSVRPTLRPSDSPSVRPGLRPPVFHSFLIHALTYWAEILHITLF